MPACMPWGRSSTSIRRPCAASAAGCWAPTPICPTASAIAGQRAALIYRPLDVERMAAAAALLVGDHDFSAFRAAGCQAHSPIRRLHELSVRRCGDRVVIEATANAFLQHMVRNLVGLLLEVGVGKAPPQWAAEVLAARDRTRSAATAPAHGL